MNRAERKNMIDFIEKMRGISKEQLIYMTDSEIEYIYNRTYYQFEEIAE